MPFFVLNYVKLSKIVSSYSLRTKIFLYVSIKNPFAFSLVKN